MAAKNGPSMIVNPMSLSSGGTSIRPISANSCFIGTSGRPDRARTPLISEYPQLNIYWASTSCNHRLARKPNGRSGRPAGASRRTRQLVLDLCGGKLQLDQTLQFRCVKRVLHGREDILDVKRVEERLDLIGGGIDRRTDTMAELLELPGRCFGESFRDRVVLLEIREDGWLVLFDEPRKIKP